MKKKPRVISGPKMQLSLRKVPADVAHVLSVSYYSALRLMERTTRTIDLAKPRTRKRLLLIKGKHLREYLDGKLK